MAFASLFALGAPLYFFVFWHWFDFWRTRRALWWVMLFTTFGAVYGAGYLARAWVWAGRIDVPLPVVAAGWLLIAAANVLGFFADRQIGLRVRSFRPFFDTGSGARIELRTTGAYGIVRHPIYASGSATVLGVFLVTGYPSALVMWVVFTVGALWFTRQEERRLVALLDDPGAYERYREQVPALLPRLSRRARRR